ncbi:MAG: HNH endonuclease [Chloroflexi bacterium CFX6]|nr:HNH endonuclease [Chloroflexi bacterium CFX6]MEB2345211.1 HNH endonuclease [Deltaproteobacteria bacterium]
MQAYVGITDYEWYQLLASRPQLDDVNFWQPGGTRVFRALQAGELFLFKLHAPRHSVVGGGFFAHATRLPVSLAWEAFGESNGASSLAQMRARIEQYRRAPAQPHEDYTIGCILLEQPFFLPEELWIPAPPDWHPNIVQGKTYDLNAEPGRSLWLQVEERIRVQSSGQGWPAQWREPGHPRYGEPTLVRPRLGQGSFRILVTDAYDRRCAVTGERVLPVLQAAHIRPYAAGGEHRVDNGLLLRSDLHTLFDRGYVTVTPELRLEVSRRIREDFENGRHYYALHGERVREPVEEGQRPAAEFLRWHNEQAFLE